MCVTCKKNNSPSIPKTVTATEKCRKFNEVDVYEKRKIIKC